MGGRALLYADKPHGPIGQKPILRNGTARVIQQNIINETHGIHPLSGRKRAGNSILSSLEFSAGLKRWTSGGWLTIGALCYRDVPLDAFTGSDPRARRQDESGGQEFL